MLEMVNRWYKRRFSDPHAVSLVAIILFGFITIYSLVISLRHYWLLLFWLTYLSGPLPNFKDLVCQEHHR